MPTIDEYFPNTSVNTLLSHKASWAAKGIECYGGGLADVKIQRAQHKLGFHGKLAHLLIC